MFSKTYLLPLGAVAILGCSVTAAQLSAEGKSMSSGTVLSGNVDCHDLVMEGLLAADEVQCSVKIEPVADGTYAIFDCEGEDGSITIDVTGSYFDWLASMNIAVSAVIVKGGPDSNVYLYDPAAQSDTGLHAPINPSNGSPYGLSHITFCAVEAPPVGALEILKTTKMAGQGEVPLEGVEFTITDDSSGDEYVVTTDEFGRACVDGLSALSSFTVEETVPTGYDDSDAVTEDVSVAEDGTCAGTPTLLEIENVPLSDIVVSFNSQIPDATVARIQCFDEWGDPLPSPDLTPKAFDDEEEVYAGLLPGTYECIVVIDP